MMKIRVILTSLALMAVGTAAAAATFDSFFDIDYGDYHGRFEPAPRVHLDRGWSGSMKLRDGRTVSARLTLSGCAAADENHDKWIDVLSIDWGTHTPGGGAAAKPLSRDGQYVMTARRPRGCRGVIHVRPGSLEPPGGGTSQAPPDVPDKKDPIGAPPQPPGDLKSPTAPPPPGRRPNLRPRQVELAAPSQLKVQVANNGAAASVPTKVTVMYRTREGVKNSVAPLPAVPVGGAVWVRVALPGPAAAAQSCAGRVDQPNNNIETNEQDNHFQCIQ